MLFITLSFVFISWTLIEAAPNKTIQVRIPNGIVEGQVSETENNRTFYAFQGMRYATPPIDNLRFRAPLPAQNWSGVYDATAERSVCLSSPYNNATVVGSEDCLYINVYTTKLNVNASTRTDKLSVIVWIHGGGFVYNSGNIGLHGADRFLDHNVVVVTLNYRLGVFGFLCTKDNAVPGNYGLKDQILALEWVQQNIEVFGGDKNKVTIFGESAGAASVHYLRQTERARGLFVRVIADSGSTLNPWTQARNPVQIAFRIGLLNAIWTVSTKTLVEQLRKVDSVKLQRTTVVPFLLDLWDPLNGLPFAPCIEIPSDEAVVTDYSYEVQRNGKFNRGELLHGFNSLEGREAANLPWLGILLIEPYNLDSSKLTPADMNASNAGNRAAGEKIKSYYFHNETITPNAYLVNFVSDDEFVRGIVKTSELESLYTSVYLYRFSFTGGATHSYFNPEGVSHAEELQFLFLDNSTVQRSPAAKLTSERVVEMWTNFAKFGNPTPTPTEAVNVTWLKSNASGYDSVHYLDIGVDLVPSVNPEEAQMEFWDNLYYEYGYPPYNTY